MTRLFPLLFLLPLTGCDGLGSALGLDWTRDPHPCVANRTDALHVDDDGTLWVGCGTGTRGEGLYRCPACGKPKTELHAEGCVLRKRLPCDMDDVGYRPTPDHSQSPSYAGREDSE